MNNIVNKKIFLFIILCLEICCNNIYNKNNKIDIFTKNIMIHNFLHNSHLDHSSDDAEIDSIINIMNDKKITKNHNYSEIDDAWQKFKLNYYITNNDKFFEIGNYFRPVNSENYFEIAINQEMETVFFQPGLNDVKNRKHLLKKLENNRGYGNKMARMYFNDDIIKANSTMRTKFFKLHPELIGFGSQQSINNVNYIERREIILCVKLNKQLTNVERVVFADYNSGTILLEFSQFDILNSFGADQIN